MDAERTTLSALSALYYIYIICRICCRIWLRPSQWRQNVAEGRTLTAHLTAVLSWCVQCIRNILTVFYDHAQCPCVNRPHGPATATGSQPQPAPLLIPHCFVTHNHATMEMRRRNGSRGVVLSTHDATAPERMCHSPSPLSWNSTEPVFLAASSWHPREDARNKPCVSCSWTAENDTDTRTNGQHYTAADRRPTNQVSAWQAGRGSRHARHARLVAGHPREDVTRMLRGKWLCGILALLRCYLQLRRMAKSSRSSCRRLSFCWPRRFITGEQTTYTVCANKKTIP